MKPFHYHEDPLYAAAAAILASQTSYEDALQEAIQLDEASGEFPKIEKRKNDGYTEAFMVLNDWFFSKGKKGTLNKATEAEEKELLSLYKSTGLKTDSAINLSRINEHALEEGVEDIAAAVANFKKGDKTNFGVVTDVSSTSISFKAKDLPITKIAFNQRKMGSKDFVLDKLVKLKEGVELEEAMGMGTATITAPGNKLHGKQVSIFHKFDDGRLNVQYAKSDKKGDVLNLTLKKDQYKLD